MEPMSLIPVTFASILATLSGADGPREEAVINSHFSPEIAGLWELQLQEIPEFAQPDAQMSEEVSSNDKDLDALIAAIRESSQMRIEDIERELGATGSVDENEMASQAERMQQVDVPALNAANSGLCRERYNFGSDNEVLTTSGEEWTYGQYLYQHQPEGLPIIAITTSYDNNKVDCSGRRIDQTGDAMLAFVDYQPDNNVMRWCIDKDGDNCFMTLHKLLP